MSKKLNWRVLMIVIAVLIITVEFGRFWYAWVFLGDTYYTVPQVDQGDVAVYIGNFCWNEPGSGDERCVARFADCQLGSILFVLSKDGKVEGMSTQGFMPENVRKRFCDGRMSLELE